MNSDPARPAANAGSRTLGGVATSHSPSFDRNRLAAIVDRFAGRRIAVLGDVMLDRESRADLGGEALARLIAALDRELKRCEGLIVSDYGKGVVHPGPLHAALGLAKRLGIPACVDPKESHIDSYRGVDIITPNQHE